MTSLPDHMVFQEVNIEGDGADLGKETKILLLPSFFKQLPREYNKNVMAWSGESKNLPQSCYSPCP